MNRLLADLQLLLWYTTETSRMPKPAYKRMLDQDNIIYYSLVSIWEASIKFALKRPDYSMPPRELRNELKGFGFVELPIEAEHVIAVSRLPFHHRDPFDRLLIAQAEVEGLTLMTTDKKMAQYGPFVHRF